MLQQIARRIAVLAEDHPGMPLRYKSPLDFLSTLRGGFLSTFRGGGWSAKSAAPNGETSAEESGRGGARSGRVERAIRSIRAMMPP
ncbi:hypothetical protein [Sorangium sp. So ce1000]|uniref:hypothetical protein n=1 Tax=Sorangium sp. So ce1000 TaxID=3133325 RepID=UPI003F61B544